MKKKTILGIIIIALVVIILAVWSGKEQNPDIIKIGMIGPFAGNYASVGETYQNGAILAVDEINAKNSGKKVELVVEDGAFDPVKSLSAYKKLTGVDKVNAIIAVDTVSIDSIYKDANTANIPVINGGEQSLAPADDNVFQINPGNYDSEVALGKLVKQDGKKNVVLITGNHEVFFRFAKGFKEGYQNGNADGNADGKLFETIVSFTEKDVRTLALKIKAENPDAVAMILTPDLMARFTKTFADLGVKNVSYYYDADLQFGWDSAVKVADANIFNGAKVVTINNFTDDKFVKQYKQRFGQDKETLTANSGYDAVMMLVEDYDSNSSNWIKNLKNDKYSGVSGKIAFNQFGIRIPEFKIGTIEGGVLPR